MDDVGVTGKDVLKVDVANAKKTLVFQASALRMMRQRAIDARPMFENIAYCHSQLIFCVVLSTDYTDYTDFFFLPTDSTNITESVKS